MTTFVRYNNVSSFGLTNPATLALNDVIIYWPLAPPFPTIASPNVAKIVLAPDTVNEEIIYLTAYTAGALSGTVTRNAEATQGGANASPLQQGVAWRHGPTVLDFPAEGNAGISELGYNQVTSNVQSASMTPSSTGMPTVTCITPATAITVELYCPTINAGISGGGSFINFTLKVDGSQVQYTWGGDNVASWSSPHSCKVRLTLTAGSHTFTGFVNSQSNSVTVQAAASATAPMYLQVVG